MLDQIVQELQDLGLNPRIVRFSSPPFYQAVVFDVHVEHGRYKDQTLSVGLSFQELAYPEYPPHFVHFKSSIETNIACRHSAHDFEGAHWSAYSLPPSDFWDRLDSSEKSMKTYVHRHLQRILARL